MACFPLEMELRNLMEQDFSDEEPGRQGSRSASGAGASTQRSGPGCSDSDSSTDDEVRSPAYPHMVELTHVRSFGFRYCWKVQETKGERR